MPEKTTIADTDIPSAGRIYDYLLGGHHNFEIDRQVGDKMKELMPFIPKQMRLARWCLQDLARTLTTERGFGTIIDFASGLPTMDHIHTAVAPGATVIYSDHDPVTVEYARDILGDTPNAYYFEADCRRPEELLNRSELQEILGDSRQVAFVYWGVSMYISDEDIAYATRVLYDWSDENSCLAFYISVQDPEASGTAGAIELTRQLVREERYFRPLEVFKELVKPWRPDELGYRTMAEWHSIKVDMTAEDLKDFAAGGGGYGVYLVK